MLEVLIQICLSHTDIEMSGERQIVCIRNHRNTGALYGICCDSNTLCLVNLLVDNSAFEMTYGSLLSNVTIDIVPSIWVC